MLCVLLCNVSIGMSVAFMSVLIMCTSVEMFVVLICVCSCALVSVHTLSV